MYNCYKKIQRGNIKSQIYWLRLHKVLTYVEYRAVPGVFQNIEPPTPLSPQRMCPYPRAKGGGGGGWGGGGQYFGRRQPYYWPLTV